MKKFTFSPIALAISLALAQTAQAVTLDLTFDYRLTPTQGATETIATAHFEDVVDYKGDPAVDLKLTNIASNKLPGVGSISYISGMLLAFDYTAPQLPSITVEQFNDDNAQSDRWEPQEDVATVDGFTFTSELGFPRSETSSSIGARLAVGESAHIQFINDGSLPNAITVAKIIEAVRGSSVASGAPKVMAAVKVRSIPNLTSGEVIESVPTIVIGAAVPVLNHVPLANAGSDSNVKYNELVVLDGSTSTDSENDSLTYEWTQISGTPVTLANANQAKPSFNAPSSVEQLVFSLKVSDGKLQSTADTVFVNVSKNNAPIVNAGADQSVNEASKVSLLGAATDADGDTVSYQWRQISGTPVSLTEANQATLTFTAPWIAKDPETLEFELTATDSFKAALAASDTVKVIINNDGSLMDCSQAKPDRASLWPANAGFVNVKVLGFSSPKLTGKNPVYDLQIDSITQDEPLKNPVLKDKTSPDAKVTKTKRTAKKPLAKDVLFLRAERQGVQPKGKPFTGNGRVYQIAFTANDGAQSCKGNFSVQVPGTRTGIAIDERQLYDAKSK